YFSMPVHLHPGDEVDYLFVSFVHQGLLGNGLILLVDAMTFLKLCAAFLTLSLFLVSLRFHFLFFFLLFFLFYFFFFSYYFLTLSFFFLSLRLHFVSSCLIICALDF